MIQQFVLSPICHHSFKYLNADKIGYKNRAESCCQQLSELNDLPDQMREIFLLVSAKVSCYHLDQYHGCKLKPDCSDLAYTSLLSSRLTRGVYLFKSTVTLVKTFTSSTKLLCRSRLLAERMTTK